MDNAAKAQAEYERLRSLIGGKHPKGDCQLVSLMIARAIEGDIIDGMVSFEEGEPIWHFGRVGQTPASTHWQTSGIESPRCI